jgi:hypothetical protein
MVYNAATSEEKLMNSIVIPKNTTIPTSKTQTYQTSEDNERIIEVDITHRPDIASRFNVLQTPTTLVLDNSGAIAARIGGAPRPEAVRTALEIALRRDHGNYVI